MRILVVFEKDLNIDRSEIICSVFWMIFEILWIFEWLLERMDHDNDDCW